MLPEDPNLQSPAPGTIVLCRRPLLRGNTNSTMVSVGEGVWPMEASMSSSWRVPLVRARGPSGVSDLLSPPTQRIPQATAEAMLCRGSEHEVGAAEEGAWAQRMRVQSGNVQVRCVKYVQRDSVGPRILAIAVTASTRVHAGPRSTLRTRLSGGMKLIRG